MIETNIFSTGAQKLLFFPNEIKSWQNCEAVTPITLEIQPSEICNHHCPQCQGFIVPSNNHENAKPMRGCLLNLSLLDSVWNSPPRGIIISGNTGDPLLHPEIKDLLTTIKNFSIPVVLITNGQALTESVAKIIVDTCVGVRISLDAFNDRSFMITHGMNSNNWKQLLRNITLLVNMKRSKANSNCLIGIAFLTNEQTKEWMIPATKLAKKLDVDYIQFRPYHFDRTDVIKILKNCEKYENNHFNVFSSYQKYSMLGEGLSQRSKNCQAAWFYTVIDARGDIYICCHNIGNSEAMLGSLKYQSWNMFIKSGRRRDIINNFSTESCIPNCRLQTQNELLSKIKTTKKNFEIHNYNNQIHNHAVFL